MRTALLILGLLALTACSSGSTPAEANTASSGVARQLPVVALPGYTVSIFTQQDSRLAVTAPDSIAVDGQKVFIDYQNVTAKDCSDQTGSAPPSSTVVEYDMNGKILGHWSVAGHSDGMRIDPTTHLVWTTSCEDEDTVWPSGPGRLLVVDGGGITYWISGTFNAGDAYTQAPNDSGIDNFDRVRNPDRHRLPESDRAGLRAQPLTLGRKMGRRGGPGGPLGTQGAISKPTVGRSYCRHGSHGQRDPPHGPARSLP